MSRQAALRALELNGMLPEAHSMLGVLRALEFDWKEAEREFRVSLELDPRSEDVWVNYAWHYITPMGRLNQAIEAMQKVLERDPLSLIAQGLLGFCNYFLRKWDDAILHWRSALDLDPQYYSAHVWLILNYIQKGMIDEGIQACETALSHWRDMNLAVGIIGLAFARAGRTAQARELLKELQDRARTAYVLPSSLH